MHFIFKLLDFKAVKEKLFPNYSDLIAFTLFSSFSHFFASKIKSRHLWFNCYNKKIYKLRYKKHNQKSIVYFFKTTTTTNTWPKILRVKIENVQGKRKKKEKKKKNTKTVLANFTYNL